MTAAYVTHIDIPGGASGGTSAGVDTTGATLLVVSVSWYGSSARPTLTDSKSNTWVALTEQKFSVAGNVLFYCKNPTAGSGHTFTLSGSSIYSCGQMEAFSGTNTSAPFDVESGATSSAFSLATGSITPTVDGCVIVAGLSAGDGTAGYSIGSGFTVTDAYNHNPSAAEGGAAAYLIQTTAAAVNPTWSASTPGSSPGVAATIAAFKPATGGPAFIAAQGLNLRQAVRRASVW